MFGFGDLGQQRLVGSSSEEDGWKGNLIVLLYIFIVTETNMANSPAFVTPQEFWRLKSKTSWWFKYASGRWANNLSLAVTKQWTQKLRSGTGLFSVNFNTGRYKVHSCTWTTTASCASLLVSLMEKIHLKHLILFRAEIDLLLTKHS